jgi:DNA (cytosine-5)-methyltransferase 1
LRRVEGLPSDPWVPLDTNAPGRYPCIARRSTAQYTPQLLWSLNLNMRVSGQAQRPFTSIEICAGAGGQALGLEQAGFRHVALVELEHHACDTLRLNRRKWNVIEADVREFVSRDAPLYRGASLVAGGVPCPPFSVAGKQMGADDDRDLFPAAIDLVEVIDPDAVMLENVRGLLDPRFQSYRGQILDRLDGLGYWGKWALLNASDFGVPQLRPRAVLVAIRKRLVREVGDFQFPTGTRRKPPTVGAKLYKAMASRGWVGANEFKNRATSIAPTLVGGSKKHGGPDLGPTRAKRAWAAMGVNAHLIANEPPGPDFVGAPHLTVEMAALLQGFPSSWKFAGAKTAAYRQVGNAFPPPVAKAVGRAIIEILSAAARPASLTA